MVRMLLSVPVAILIAGLSARPAAGQGGQPIADGESLFKTYCASCHGATARGTGAVAVFLRVQPADLTQIAKRNKGVFPADQVHAIIDGRKTAKAHGASQMPVWGDAFSKSVAGGEATAVDARIKALVAYLASIQEKPAK
jgi:mono/diheme cytochrome c family protein